MSKDRDCDFSGCPYASLVGETHCAEHARLGKPLPGHERKVITWHRGKTDAESVKNMQEAIREASQYLGSVDVREVEAPPGRRPFSTFDIDWARYPLLDAVTDNDTGRGGVVDELRELLHEAEQAKVREFNKSMSQATMHAAELQTKLAAAEKVVDVHVRTVLESAMVSDELRTKLAESENRRNVLVSEVYTMERLLMESKKKLAESEKSLETALEKLGAASVSPPITLPYPSGDFRDAARNAARNHAGPTLSSWFYKDVVGRYEALIELYETRERTALEFLCGDGFERVDAAAKRVVSERDQARVERDDAVNDQETSAQRFQRLHRAVPGTAEVIGPVGAIVVTQVNVPYILDDPDRSRMPEAMRQAMNQAYARGERLVQIVYDLSMTDER